MNSTMRMKINFKFIVLLLGVSLTSCQQKDVEKWNLAWEDDFNGTELDLANWSKVGRGTADWNNYMTDDNACYAVEDGNLILRGIKNDDLEKDTAICLTGGVWGLDKQAFGNGRIEIKAKVDEGIGAWPAIWLLPQGARWPLGGEIDIMEHLNHDEIVYQTVHTTYTLAGNRTNPLSNVTAPLKRNDYNVYACEMYPDSLRFFVNDELTLTYPRTQVDHEDQFPFNDHEFYLVLSMQLGGSWVGAVDLDDLPLEMKIDWVRFYELNPKWKEK